MQEFHFQSLPEEYKVIKDQITSQFVKKLYSTFNYIYFPYSTYTKEENKENSFKEINKFLFSHLINYKFIVYHTNDIHDSRIFEDQKEKSTSSEFQKVIICTEGYCLIIDEIDINNINKIIDQLKQESISILNVTPNQIKMSDLKEEIESVKKISDYTANVFVQITIDSIAGFCIRRFYYPTHFFQDPSFFVSNNKIIAEKMRYLTNFSDFLFSKNLNPNVSPKPTAQVLKRKNYQENDFIVLRGIYSSQKSSLRLVMHKENLSLFVMKKIGIFDEKTNHENKFCELEYFDKFVPFYGYIMDKNKKIGFIYEFMSNGTLQSFISSHSKTCSEPFALFTIIRIITGIHFLQDHSLIHRDLKPTNILIDHDFIHIFRIFKQFVQ